MAVHGVRPATGKDAENETGDWSLKTNTGKVVLDQKKKPITGLSFAAVSLRKRAHYFRTGEWTFAVRA